VHEHVFTAIITNDEAETLLGVEKLDDTGAGADVDAGAHVTGRTRAAEATTAAATEAATATTAAAETTATAAAAEAVTTTATETIAAAEAVTTTETVTAAKAALELVEPALTLVDTTTPGPTSAFIKAHFRSKSFSSVKLWSPSAAMRMYL
jgi:hypothetical protein